jgi:hypothetical protein
VFFEHSNGELLKKMEHIEEYWEREVTLGVIVQDADDPEIVIHFSLIASAEENAVNLGTFYLRFEMKIWGARSCLQWCNFVKTWAAGSASHKHSAVWGFED